MHLPPTQNSCERQSLSVAQVQRRGAAAAQVWPPAHWLLAVQAKPPVTVATGAQ